MIRSMLTPRQRDVLAVIATHILVHRMPPTVRELGVALARPKRPRGRPVPLSPNGTHSHLRALRKKGWVDFLDSGRGTLRILAWPREEDVYLGGNVFAGGDAGVTASNRPQSRPRTPWEAVPPDSSTK